MQSYANMKYPVKIYSKSLVEALVGKKDGEQEKIILNLISLVKKNRDEFNLKKILEETQTFYLKKIGRNKIVFKFARPKENYSKILKSVARDGDVVEEKINPELIAGAKIIVNGERQFDYSLAKKINKIARNY